MQRILTIQSAKTTCLGGNRTRLELWEEHLKDPIVALDKSFEVCGAFVLRLTVGPGPFVEVVFNGLWSRGSVAQAWCQRCGTNLGGKEFALTWIRVCAQSPRIGTFQGSTGRMVSFFFFLMKKESMVLSDLVESEPFFSAATV